MKHVLEMADGARINLDDSGWYSPERPALADVLNRVQPTKPDEDLAKKAHTVGNRYGWTHFIHNDDTALNSGATVNKTELPAGDDTISRKKPFTFK